MKIWKIRYWNGGGKKGPVEKWFDRLTKEQLKLVVKEISIYLKRLAIILSCRIVEPLVKDFLS